ncbi:hypothetical protein [Microcoleus sp. FACHB-672]|nr:hypothetical protein [Microcoleus sp. FACHB-672]MBD2041268.1 hypothetical protein [Microcoleus sp. FACHB-672]
MTTSGQDARTISLQKWDAPIGINVSVKFLPLPCQIKLRLTYVTSQPNA